MPKLSSWLHVIDNISEWTGKVFSFTIFLLISIVVYEVVSRRVFMEPTIWVHETSAFLFGVYFILGGAYTLLLRAHVNMDILYNRFPPRMKPIVDVLGSAFLFLFCGALLWKGTELAWRSLIVGELTSSAWQPPLYPMKIAIAVGAFLIVLQGLAKLIRDLVTAVRGGAEI